MNTDITPIILAGIGTGITLLGILSGLLIFLFRILRQDMATLRQDVDSRYKDLREEFDSRHKESRRDLAEFRQEMRTDIGALHSRIDNLYQALFGHKDPAA